MVKPVDQGSSFTVDLRRSTWRAFYLGVILELIAFGGFLWSIRGPSDGSHPPTRWELVFLYAQFPGMFVGLRIVMFMGPLMELLALPFGIVVGFGIQVTLFALPLWFVSRWALSLRHGKL